MKVLFVVLMLSLAAFEQSLAASGPRTLPKNFVKCQRNDPNVSDCVRHAVEDAFQKMKTKGVPSLGVLPIDPLDVQDLQINSGNPNDPVNLRLHFKNMKLYGAGDTTYPTYVLDYDNTLIHTVSQTPYVSFVADYTADGKVLILPVKGQGIANFTMYEVETTSDLNFKAEEKDGETYWKIQSFKPKFSPKKVTMHFSGLIAQDKSLSDGVNNFLNENSQIVFESIKPELEASFGAIFKEITDRIFSKVPIDKIFLP